MTKNKTSTGRESYDFYHATDARRQGVAVVIYSHLVLLAFGSVLYLLHSQFAMQFARGFLYGMIGVLSVVYLFILAYAGILITAGGQWAFAVRNGILEVRSPAKVVGGTFTISVAEIVSITQAKSSDGSSSYFCVVTKDGEKYEITQNSGLDLYDFFAKLRELNPHIQKEYDIPAGLWDAVRRSLGHTRP